MTVSYQIDEAIRMLQHVEKKYLPDHTRQHLNDAIARATAARDELRTDPFGKACTGTVTFIVTIQDKSLYGEPAIALAIVEATDETAARRTADETINALAASGRGRCVPHVRPIDLGRFYRLGALVRLPPRDRDADPDDTHFKEDK